MGTNTIIQLLAAPKLLWHPRFPGKVSLLGFSKRVVETSLCAARGNLGLALYTEPLSAFAPLLRDSGVWKTWFCFPPMLDWKRKMNHRFPAKMLLQTWGLDKLIPLKLLCFVQIIQFPMHLRGNKPENELLFGHYIFPVSGQGDKVSHFFQWVFIYPKWNAFRQRF